MDNCSNAEQKLSNAVVQTKVVNCNSANKSCLFHRLHTKAITASTQFCDYFHPDHQNHRIGMNIRSSIEIFSEIKSDTLKIKQYDLSQ